MLKVQKDVLLYGIKPALNIALQVALSVYNLYGWDMLIVSGAEKLDFTGNTVGLCIKPIPKNLIGQTRGQIAGNLNSEFMVTREAMGEVAEHIRIEYVGRENADHSE